MLLKILYTIRDHSFSYADWGIVLMTKCIDGIGSLTWNAKISRFSDNQWL